MRRYYELTDEEKRTAHRKVVNDLLKHILQHGLHFGEDELQIAIEEAIDEAEAMQTPWFAGEYIWDATYNVGEEEHRVRDRLKEIARAEAQEAFYPESGELVVRI